MTESSSDLIDLALFAIDHATNSVVPEGGPLIPFAILEKEGGRSLHRFQAERLEEMVAAGRAFVRGQEDLDRVAFAWDGYFTLDGVRSDALFVEASEASAESSLIFVQRYETRGLFRKRAHTVGEPLQAGTGRLF